MERPQAGPAQRIVLYEDDAALAAEIVQAFAEEGHKVGVAASADEVVAVAGTGQPAILIMDRMIHGTDSLALVAAIRAAGHRTPVIVISSLSSVDDRIEGLRTGGDDYLVKPFAMGELVARVEAMMRRAGGDAGTRLATGDLVMDVLSRTVQRGGRTITLAPREFGLLEYLMRHPGQIITRSMILESVWKYRAPLETNVVDVHMSSLRRKIDLEGEKQLIRSKRGLGFVLGGDGD